MRRLNMPGAKLVVAAFAAAFAGEAGAEPAFVAVAEAVEALARVEPGKADAALPAGVEVWENGAGRSSPAALAGYARECPLERIGRFSFAAPTAGETLIQVRWACVGREPANEALFSVVDGKIARVSFRPIPIVRVR